jgi:hypothetical protein
VLECAASDIGAVEELYYTTTDTELIVSTDFFDLATAKEQLTYNTSEVLYFIRHGYCRAGKSTFDKVYRLPPGKSLSLDINGVVETKDYLDFFKGGAVTYDVFKTAVHHSIDSIIRSEPSFKEVVMYSGGVDSSVLLSLVAKIKDVTAVTYRIIPPIIWNEPDVVRSKRTANRMGIPQEFIDVDLNELDLTYLDDVILSMPLAAHPSVYFKKVFEKVRGQKNRLWCGQDLDTLYYNAVTDPFFVINRFLLSNMYSRSLKGVHGYRKYRAVKKALDLPLIWLCQAIYNQKFEAPNSIDELVEYFNDSDQYLALRVAGEKRERQVKNIGVYGDIGAKQVRKKLFDEGLRGECTGHDHKIQLMAMTLYNLPNTLLYSTPNMVHLLRNLNLTWLDIPFTKRFVYRYARELGLRGDDLRTSRSVTKSRKARQDWAKTFDQTNFGIELAQRARDLSANIGFIPDTTDKNRIQKELGVLWISKVHEKLYSDGVELDWPIFAK